MRLLVIAADDGVMPQTIEHVQILQLLGVKNGTIVLNKADLVSVDRLHACRTAVDEFKSDLFLQDAKVFDVAATSGQGIDALRDHLVQTAQHFDSTASSQPFRLAIDRSFSLRGVGTVVTGTVTSGSVKVGDEVNLTATRNRVRIRNLNVQGLEAETAYIGDRCSLNIAGTDVSRAERGDWLLSPIHDLPIRRVYVDLTILSDFPRHVKHWSSVHVYHLTDHSEARLALLEGNLAKPGASTLAELYCEEDMHFKAGDRVILRDRDLSRTLGGATVLGYSRDPHIRRRSKTNLSFLNLLKPAVQEHDHVRALERYASYGLVNIDEFTRFGLCTRDEIQQFLESNEVSYHDDFVISSEIFERIASQIDLTLTEFHELHPSQEGMTVSLLETRVPTSLDCLQFVLDRLVERRKLRHVAGQYALSEHEAQGPTYDISLFERVKPMFDADQPMSLGDAAKRLNMSFNDIEKAMRPMVAAKALVQVNKNRYFTPERIDELRQVASVLAAQKPFTVREFRDTSGLGRNTVIDVLEYFDRQRVTQRRGDVRSILK